MSLYEKLQAVGFNDYTIRLIECAIREYEQEKRIESYLEILYRNKGE